MIWIPIDNISQIAEFADGNEVMRAKKAWQEAQGEDVEDDLKRLLLQQLLEKLSEKPTK